MEIEIWLQKKDHTMTKQTSESGKAKKISRDEELDCYFGPGLSISFPPSTLMNVSSLLPPRFNYSPRTLRPPPNIAQNELSRQWKQFSSLLKDVLFFSFFLEERCCQLLHIKALLLWMQSFIFRPTAGQEEHIITVQDPLYGKKGWAERNVTSVFAKKQLVCFY